MAKMKLTSLSEHINKAWGEIGTPERDAMEVKLEEEVNAYFVEGTTASLDFGTVGKITLW